MKLRVTVEGKTYEVEVDLLEEEGAPAPPSTRSAPPAPVAPASAPAAPPPRPAASAPAAAGGKTYPSPLAGTVRAVHVKAGDSVEANQEIMVLEAMKMETSVSAPSAGRIKAVLVSVGDAVASGQGLVEFE